MATRAEKDVDEDGGSSMDSKEGCAMTRNELVSTPNENEWGNLFRETAEPVA